MVRPAILEKLNNMYGDISEAEKSVRAAKRKEEDARKEAMTRARKDAVEILQYVQTWKDFASLAKQKTTERQFLLFNFQYPYRENTATTDVILTLNDEKQAGLEIILRTAIAGGKPTHHPLDTIASLPPISAASYTDDYGTTIEWTTHPNQLDDFILGAIDKVKSKYA